MSKWKFNVPRLTIGVQSNLQNYAQQVAIGFSKDVIRDFIPAYFEIYLKHAPVRTERFIYATRMFLEGEADPGISSTGFSESIVPKGERARASEFIDTNNYIRAIGYDRVMNKLDSYKTKSSFKLIIKNDAESDSGYGYSPHVEEWGWKSNTGKTPPLRPSDYAREGTKQALDAIKKFYLSKLQKQVNKDIAKVIFGK